MRRGLRPPTRGAPLGRGFRGRGGIRAPTNRPVHVNIESSSDDSYSDDIPVIKTKTTNKNDYSYSEDSYSYERVKTHKQEAPKTKVSADLISDYDYSDDFEEGIPVCSENHPIQNTPLQNHNKHKENNSENETTQVRQISTKEVNSNTLNNKTEKSDENISINTNNQSQSKPEISNDHQQIQNPTEVTQKTVVNQAPESNHNQDQLLDSQKKEIESQKQPDTVTPAPAPSNNLLDDDCNLPIYRIVWKKSIHSKSHIQLVFNDDIIFHSKEKKTKIGNCFVICTDSNIDCYSKSYQGSLKISQSSTRFTLFTPQGEQYQGHEGEVMGLSFYDPKEIKCYGVRAFRIALPKKHPYFPSTKDMNLSKIAQKNVKSDDIQIYSSKLPELFPGPVLKLQFGNVHVVSSVKNFILEDEDGNVIFMIYKSSNGMCSLRIAPPITPLIAFSLSIAIITSRK